MKSKKRSTMKNRNILPIKRQILLKIIRGNILAMKRRKRLTVARVVPNILVCGTPGTGKSTISKLLMTRLADNGFHNYKYIEVSDFCREHQCIKLRDSQLNCDIIDEKKLIGKLKPIIENGGHVIDYHSIYRLLPRKLIDFVYVIRCDNTVLFDRLKARNYSDLKRENNLQCEIFGEIATEASDWFDARLVHQLINDTNDDLSRNVELIVKCVVDYKAKLI